MHQNANTAPKRKQSSASTNNNSPRTLPPLDTALWRIIQQLEDTIILLRFKSTLTSTFGKCVSFPWHVLKERSVYARSRATVFGVRLSPALPRAGVTVERANVSRRWERIDYGAKFRPNIVPPVPSGCTRPAVVAAPLRLRRRVPYDICFDYRQPVSSGGARETTTRGGIAFAAKSKRQLVRSHTHTHTIGRAVSRQAHNRETVDLPLGWDAKQVDSEDIGSLCPPVGYGRSSGTHADATRSTVTVCARWMSKARVC